MNTQITTSSKIYANSLISVNTDYDKVLDELKLVSEVIKNSKDLSETLKNPAISKQTKFEILEEVFKTRIDEKILNFLKVLLDKDKFGEFDEIYAAYLQMYDDIKNIKRVKVVSAIDLSDNWKTKITEKLNQKFQKTVIASWETDEKIIGGLVIKSEDEIFDASLKNKLYKLSKM